MTKHPVPDKAEVAIDFPEKFYMGSFARDCQFEARAEANGVFVRLQKGGAHKKSVELHLHYDLFAEILTDFADTLADAVKNDPRHREALAAACAKMSAALKA
jgi:hypothetical protein